MKPRKSPILDHPGPYEAPANTAWEMYNERIAWSTSSLLRRHKGTLFRLFLAATLVNLFALVLPLFSSFVYDKILGNGITDTLWALVIGIGIVVSIEFCIRLLRVNSVERFAAISEIEIDDSTFRGLLDSPTNKMPQIGSLLEKYKQVLSYRDFLSSSYFLSLVDIPFVVLFMVAITIVAGPLVYISLATGALMLVTGLLFMAPVLDYDRQAKKAGERRFGLMSDVLTARDAIIGYAFRKELFTRWQQSSVSAAIASSKARYWRVFGATIINSLSYCAYIGVLVGGVYLVEAHELTSGGLLAATMLTSRTMAGFNSINTLVIRYREFRNALNELNNLAPAKQATGGVSRGRLRGALQIDNVTVRMQKEAVPVLSGIKLNILPGEIVGIAGAPGAGKTTLLRLIAGVLTPEEGNVLIDNIPIQNLSLKDVSANIGFKPQDLCLLDGTIEDNIRAGHTSLTSEERAEILATSGLARAFQDNGLNWTTPIGARGTNISGGQRQLIAIARAIAGKPSILLLDEPTNGLDATLEGHLAQQIVAMKGKSTVLVSSHSRNILSICDRIIVLGKSQILADGPREKVLA